MVRRGGNAKLTDCRREILEGTGSEAQEERALPNARIPNQQQLEQVIEICWSRRRRRIHCTQTLPVPANQQHWH